MPWVHLPVQSGSDRILKAMNRRHSAADYLAIIARLRAARPDVALSGDFIVGFPGETRADFDATLDLIRAVGYASAYSFRYSPRPGTPAAERAQVDQAEAEARLQEVQALIDAQQRAALAAMVGRTAEVLYERPGRIAGQWAGKSEHLHAVHVADPAGQPGEIARVRILRAEPHSLAAERIG
jgi:tRNA-2-methylthio-N6-dimethylallyladenosine synthase